MKGILEKLVTVGFTKTEAVIYIELLKSGHMNGYQLAKKIGIARSSIYQSLEKMYKKGYIYMITNGSNSYEAKEPELLFNEIENSFRNYSSILKNQLKIIKKNDKKSYFLNIEGNNNINNKMAEMIKNAELEVYINIDSNLKYIRSELNDAIKRNVRILIFSFNKIVKTVAGIEYYSKTDVYEHNTGASRIMIVADLKDSLVATNVNGEMSGIFSNNEIFSRIISEHIHSDIYLSRLTRLDKKTFDKIKINTRHEINNFIQ